MITDWEAHDPVRRVRCNCNAVNGLGLGWTRDWVGFLILGLGPIHYLDLSTQILKIGRPLALGQCLTHLKLFRAFALEKCKRIIFKKGSLCLHDNAWELNTHYLCDDK